VTPCVISTMHKETRSASFLVQPENQGQWFLSVLTQNRWLRFLWFGFKTTHMGFLVLASKLTTAVWWFGPQNHRDGFLVWASKLSGRRFVGLRLKTDERMKMVWGHASTSRGLLHHEASRASVSQSSLKTGGGTTRMVHVASSRRSRGDEAQDGRVDVLGCIGLF
jgi:hypothetical protein